MSDGTDNLPIDITSNKLLDWLIDRRHVKHKWQIDSTSIQKKINHAIQDMPEVEEIKTLLAGTYINYFHCLRILELLKVSESGSKNIFGYYSSQRMKDWQEIVSLYEKDSIYLAEECEKKDKYYADAAVAAKEEYQQYCKQLGIKGEKIRAELLSLVAELPAFYESLTTDVKSLSDVVDFYGAFVQFTIESVKGGTTPLLSHLMENGNTTTYQWRKKKTPDSVEEVKLWFLEEEEETANEDEIDWGLTSDDVEDIDFNITIEDVGADQKAPIDFNIETSDTSGNIDWNIETNSGGAGDDSIARGTDALTVLDNPVTRNQFVNELLELESFLQQRLMEMQGEDDILSVNQFQSAPSNVQMKTVEDIKRMLASISNILSKMTDTRIHHLFMLKSSPQYVDRLTETVRLKKDMEEKMLASQVAMQEKRKASMEEAKQLKPKEERIIKHTRELQKQIEKEISKKYKNRPVNLMGAINTL
ncbi:putative CDK5 regulatory subunit-associated protein 3 isoform X1 [Apostichopus japonicus]|uniref:Putative CDK5 regulatory subunit-associated protein 3 isoform X1 n=1 Tax=Stichopus japonicus TaxID=307972 RepID=A0A2G8LDB7_STIJA|nr:putative CDK5 regulatory subunit-associated protein 3 isoform X1 [Apostichopus japonicus]